MKARVLLESQTLSTVKGSYVPTVFLNVLHIYVSPRRGIRFVFAPVSDRSLSLSQSVMSYLLFGITRPLLERE